MKNLIFVFCLILALTANIACSDQIELNFSENEDRLCEQSSSIVEQAKQAYEICYGSHSRANVIFLEHDIVPVSQLKSRSANNDTILYIINEANGNGFVALTAGNHPEVLAVSDNGNITNIDSIENPALSLFFESAIDYSAKKIANNSSEGTISPFPYFREELNTLADNSCPARCTTKWGQQYPEGLYCPNKTSGCNITAIAQVMCYFGQPASLELTYENADTTQIDINWTNLKNYVNSVTWDEYNNNIFKRPIQRESENTLGKICREFGHRVNASYGDYGTSSDLEQLAFNVFLAPSSINFTSGRGMPVARNILGNGILVTQGTGISTAHGVLNPEDYAHETHTWIIDGFRYRVVEHNIYVYNSSTQSYEYSEDESYTETIDLQHINWGWNGNNNGYFNTGVFNTDNALIPDSDSKDYHYNYIMSFRYFLFKVN